MTKFDYKFVDEVKATLIRSKVPEVNKQDLMKKRGVEHAQNLLWIFRKKAIDNLVENMHTPLPSTHIADSTGLTSGQVDYLHTKR